MSDINFLDKNLGHLFQAKDSFLVAKSFKGEMAGISSRRLYD